MMVCARNIHPPIALLFTIHRLTDIQAFVSSGFAILALVRNSAFTNARFWCKNSRFDMLDERLERCTRQLFVKLFKNFSTNHVRLLSARKNLMQGTMRLLSCKPREVSKFYASVGKPVLVMNRCTCTPPAKYSEGFNIEANLANSIGGVSGC